MENNNEKDLIVKAPKTTKAQIITVCVVGICVVLAIVALIIVLVLNSNQTTPEVVKFVEDGETISVQAKANDNFKGYRFKFVATDGSGEFSFDSESNQLALSDKNEIEIGKTYSVSVCYLGELEGGNSEYSKPYTWQAYKYLSVPTNFVVTIDTLSWDPIENADLYEVSYSYGTFKTLECNTNSISLSRLPAGEYGVRVVAKSNKSYYKTSFASEERKVSVYKELSPFISASISNLNLVSIVSDQTVDFVQVKVGENGEAFPVNHNLTIQGGKFLFTFDASILNIKDNTLYVRPGMDSKYWTYNGDWTEVEKTT